MAESLEDLLDQEGQGLQADQCTHLLNMIAAVKDLPSDGPRTPDSWRSALVPGDQTPQPADGVGGQGARLQLSGLRQLRGLCCLLNTSYVRFCVLATCNLVV